MNTYQPVIDLALEHFGIESQHKKAIEEMAELTLELVRGTPSMTDLAGEIADVEVMLAQLKAYHHLGAEVEIIKAEKLERLRSLIAAARHHAGM